MKVFTKVMGDVIDNKSPGHMLSPITTALQTLTPWDDLQLTITLAAKYLRTSTSASFFGRNFGSKESIRKWVGF